MDQLEPETLLYPQPSEHVHILRPTKLRHEIERFRPVADFANLIVKILRLEAPVDNFFHLLIWISTSDLWLYPVPALAVLSARLGNVIDVLVALKIATVNCISGWQNNGFHVSAHFVQQIREHSLAHRHVLLSVRMQRSLRGLDQG